MRIQQYLRQVRRYLKRASQSPRPAGYFLQGERFMLHPTSVHS